MVSPQAVNEEADRKERLSRLQGEIEKLERELEELGGQERGLLGELARMDADLQLREKELDLLTPLRKGATPEELRELILDTVWYKPWGHGLAEGAIPMNRVMSEIGG